MPAIADSLLAGATVTVETSGLPPVRFDLEEATRGPPSPVLRLLRPRVTVARGGLVIASAQPYGRPEDGLPLGLVVLAALGLLLLWATSR